MRTMEQGLLTTADCGAIVFQHEIPLIVRAHGGEREYADRCAACTALRQAINAWIIEHAATEEELTELEEVPC